MELITLSKNNPDLRRIYHVANVIDKKAYEYKPIFKYLYCDGTHLYATDAKSLHWCKIDNYKKGYYKLLSKKRTEVILHYEGEELPEGLKFPDIRLVIDPALEMASKSNEYISLDLNGRYSYSSITKLMRFIRPEHGIQIDLVQKLSQDNYKIYDTGLHKPIYFEGCEIYAIIMPIALREE